MKTARFPQKLSRGFTLIELMIVITVIGILSTIALIGFNQSQKSARDSQRLQLIKGIQSALECYQAANGKYPTVATFNWTALGTGSNFLGNCYPNATLTDPSGNANLAVFTSATLCLATNAACGYNSDSVVYSGANSEITNVTYAYSVSNNTYTITLYGESKLYTINGPK